MPQSTPVVAVDWNDTGTFDVSGTYTTSTTQYAQDIFPWVKTMTFGTGHNAADQALPALDEARLTLNNEDGRWITGNTAGALNGKLRPNVLMRIMVDGVVKFIGRIQSYESTWQLAGANTGRTDAVIVAKSGMALLSDQEIQLALLQNLRVDQALLQVLQKARNLPPIRYIGGGEVWQLERPSYSELGTTTRLIDWRDFTEFDESTITIGNYGDVRDDETQSAQRIIKDLVEAERGKFFFLPDGKAAFWNRYHVMESENGTINLGTGLSASAQSLGRPQWWPYQAPRVIVRGYPRRVEDSDVTLWETDGAFVVSRNYFKEFDAPYTYEGEITGAKDVILTDKVIAQGSGTFELNPSANKARIKIRNDSETAELFVTSFKLQGKRVANEDRISVVRQDDSTAYTYGAKGELKLNLRAIDNEPDAAEIADFELRNRTVPSFVIPYVKILSEAGGSNLVNLNWTIGTRIHIEDTNLGHAADYVIIGEQHTINAGAFTHETTFYLQYAIHNILTRNSHKLQDADMPFYTVSGSSTELLTGGTVTSSSDGGSADDNAFDGNAATYWEASTEATAPSPQWIVHESASEICIRNYAITARNHATLYQRAPATFDFQYEDATGTYQNADQVSGENWTSAGELKSYSVDNAHWSKKWRLAVYDTDYSTDDYVTVAELDGTAATYQAAQGFQIDHNNDLKYVRLWLNKYGDPRGTLNLQIYSDNSGQPNASLGTATVTVDMSDLNGAYGWHEWTFGTAVSLSANTQYWLLLSTQGKVDNNDYINWGVAEANLTEDLVSWWSLDEASGTRADSHGSATLSAVSTVTAAKGKHEDAAVFSSSRLVASSTPFERSATTDPFTAACWVKMTTIGTTSADNRFLLRYTTGQLEWMLRYDGVNGKFVFNVVDSVTVYEVASTTGAATAGRWYHVVGRYDGTNAAIFINGVGDSAARAGIDVTTSDLWIGYTTTGKVDEAAYWNRALSNAEITQLYNGGVGMAYSDVNPYPNGGLLIDNAGVWTAQYQDACFEVYGERF